MTEATDYQSKLDHAVSTVAGWLRHLIDPEQVVELRALRVQDGTSTKGGGGHSTWAGCFRGTDDELHLMARAALSLSGHCQGVYYTLNPLRTERLQRQMPRVQKVGKGQTAEDVDVLERRWLLVDIDPVKPASHKDDSATADEKAATLNLAYLVREYLTGEGRAQPILCDSGNGHHLLYRLSEPYEVTVDTLPLKDDDVIRKTLLHLADRFSGTQGEIDVKVFNPARIVKFPGTLACKGEASEERPHRRARVLEVPTS